MSAASADDSVFQMDLASGECRYAEESTAIARGATCSSRSAWILPRTSPSPLPAVITVLRGRTRKPARVSTASIQSAHMRSSGT